MIIINNDILIDKALDKDKEDISNLLYKFFLESPYSNLYFDIDKVDNILSIFINDPNYLVLIAIDNNTNNTIIGTLIASIQETLFSKDLMSLELSMYVEPEYRKQGIGNSLIGYYEQWATNKGAKLINIAALEDTFYPVLHQIYNKQGYTLNEHSYSKVVK